MNATEDDPFVEPEARRDRAALVALAGFLGLAAVLGGSGRSEAIQHLSLDLVALALIVWRLIDPGLPGLPRALIVPLTGYLLIAAVTALQLAPLPPAVWTHLPGREAVLEGLQAMGGTIPSLPLTLTPDRTFVSLADLAPPIAVLLLAGSVSRRRLDGAAGWLLGGLAAASLTLGLAQMIAGPDSALYAREFTNRGFPVGVFANVNHQGTLLLAASAVAAAWMAEIARSDSHWSRPLALLIGAGVLYLLLGVALTGSGAGWVLLGPVAAFAITAPFRGARRIVRFLLPVVGLGAAAALAALAASAPLLKQTGIDVGLGMGSLEGRIEYWTTTADLVGRSFPFGTGLGSFTEVYALQESETSVQASFVNQAHNDWLEWPLELGAPALILQAGIVVMLLIWTLRAWSGPDRVMRQGACVALWVIALHSAVDYPLRMPLMACVCALLIALAVPRETPRRAVRGRGDSSARPPAHRQTVI